MGPAVEPQLREAPVMVEGSWVGLDVHARSVVAGVLDGVSVEAGIACTVGAPSKIPRAPGDRVKTDRRDAERLARLLRLGELVAVRVPEPHEEAARDLVRAREDARGDLMRARHRLSKLLLRHGLAYDASAWTLAHDAWLRGQRFERRALVLAFDESYSAV